MISNAGGLPTEPNSNGATGQSSLNKLPPSLRASQAEARELSIATPARVNAETVAGVHAETVCFGRPCTPWEPEWTADGDQVFRSWPATLQALGEITTWEILYDRGIFCLTQAADFAKLS